MAEGTISFTSGFGFDFTGDIVTAATLHRKRFALVNENACVRLSLTEVTPSAPLYFLSTSLGWARLPTETAQGSTF